MFHPLIVHCKLPSQSDDDFTLIRKFFHNKCADFTINGFINIGNNQNLTYSELIDYITKFLLQLNNIQISKTPNGMLVKFNNYNLLLSETSKDKNMKISMQIDYLPNIHVILSPHDIAFQFLMFSKHLSEIIDKHLLQQLLQLSFQITKFIIDIKPHLHQLIPIIKSSLNLVEQNSRNIRTNDNTYLVPIDHSIYTISQAPSKHIKHLYSMSISDKQCTSGFGMFCYQTDNRDVKYVIEITYRDNDNNVCCVYITINNN